MSSTKRDDGRPGRRWAKSERPPTSQRGPRRWIVRWIGAAKRRAGKAVEVETVPNAQVIRLSWADTFGRPVRIAPARLIQLAEARIPLPPF